MRLRDDFRLKLAALREDGCCFPASKLLCQSYSVSDVISTAACFCGKASDDIYRHPLGFAIRVLPFAQRRREVSKHGHRDFELAGSVSTQV
jgi:hypothetical protein